MKKNILLICLSIFALVSCTNSDNVIYSCNPTIDSWVKSNISQIDTMKRSQWLKLSESIKKPVYRAFTKSQKQNFWIEKVNDVIQLGGWSNDEKAHLEKLLSKINDNPDWFDNDFYKNDAGMMDVEAFAYNWKDEAKDKFGWSDFFVKSILSSGNKIVDKKGSFEVIAIKSTSVRIKASAMESDTSCDCGVGYFWSTCDSSYSNTTCSSNSNCTKTYYGCSALWLSPCDGLCNPS